MSQLPSGLFIRHTLLTQTGTYFISVPQIILAELPVPGIGNVKNYLGQLIRSGTRTLCSIVYRSCRNPALINSAGCQLLPYPPHCYNFLETKLSSQ